MSPRLDPLALIAALYRVEVANDDWFAGIMAAARPLLDEGLGTAVWTLRVGPHGLTVHKTLDDSPLALADMFKAAANHEPEAQFKVVLGGPAGTMSAILGRRRMAKMPVFREFRQLGLHDILGVVGIEPDGWGLGLGAPLRTARRLSGAQRLFWQRIAAHMQAAHRLRRRLGTSRWDGPPSADAVQAPSGRIIDWSVELGGKLDPAVATAAAPTQAILDPSGRVLDAEGDARETSAREALKRAAIAVDEAKARLLRDGRDAEALAAWRALVDGRWSLTDRFENDGRRFLVARRNPPGTFPVPLLDDVERAVLGYRAVGHSLKLIAYEMGYTLSHTSRLAQGAMDKLGLRTPADLAAFVSRGPAGNDRA
jgi:hypothetical protein